LPSNYTSLAKITNGQEGARRTVELALACTTAGTV
jgi:hypothetical protein